MAQLRILTKAEDVSDHMLVLAANTVEDWYPPERPLDESDYIDRLCQSLNVEGWDIKDLNTPAVRKLLRHARQTRRGMT